MTAAERRRKWKRAHREQLNETERDRKRRKYANDPSYRAKVGARRKALYLRITSTPTDQPCAFCASAPARLMSKFCSKKCRYAAHSGPGNPHFSGGPSREVKRRAGREWSKRNRAINAAKWKERHRKLFGVDQAYTLRVRANRKNALGRLYRHRPREPGKIPAKDWLAKLDEHDHRCVYCGNPGHSMDHVIPLARGGAHAIENVIPSCWWCNRHKGSKTPSEFLKRWAPWITGVLT